MPTRLTPNERLALIGLLALVAMAAGWRWWRIHEAGRENLRSLPAAPRFEKEATEMK